MFFQEAMDYLYSRLPLFQDNPARAYRPGLQTTQILCDALDNPERKFSCVHVGGTNGKGSSSHMLASVLQAAGYRVGLYTSPHLKNFTERIRINGLPIGEQSVADFVSRHQTLIEKLSPSFFEVTVVMAFDYFARHEVDIAIIEVGMGGRLDSTNVIRPLVSLVTNISYDHQQFLGNTLPLIAAEKAGITKAEIPFVLSEVPEDAAVCDVFVKKASHEGSSFTLAPKIYEFISGNAGAEYQQLTYLNHTTQEQETYTLDLTGAYQRKNLPGVLYVLDILKTQYRYLISEEAVMKGLSSVKSRTGLKGRWQILQKDPFVVADTAHNEAGLRATIVQFLSYPAAVHRFVLGFVSDKDIEKILELLPRQGIYYFCQPGINRALPVNELRKAAKGKGIYGQTFATADDALARALVEASADDAVYVGGSTFVVADLKAI